MTVVSRRFVARPVRTAGETWTAITNLICGTDCSAAAEFLNVGGIASSLIADEALRDDPFVLVGSGPRLRIYCLYDEDAISADDKNEEALTWKPTEKEWKAFLPCASEDIDWVTAALNKQSSRFFAYDVAKGIGEGTDITKKSQSSDMRINTEGFMNL